MTDKAEFERLLDVYGFRCERFGQDLSTHARAQVVSAFAALASAPVAGEAVGHVYSMEALVPGGRRVQHAKFNRCLPDGTLLYTGPRASAAPAAFSKDGVLFWYGDHAARRGFDGDLYLAPQAMPDDVRRHVIAECRRVIGSTDGRKEPAAHALAHWVSAKLRAAPQPTADGGNDG